MKPADASQTRALSHGALMLVALIVFTAQNTVSAQIRYFGLLLAAALLAAALAGAVVTVAIGATPSASRRRAAARRSH